MLLTLLANNLMNGDRLRGPVYNPAPKPVYPADLVPQPLVEDIPQPAQNLSDGLPVKRYTDFDIPQQAAFAPVAVQPQPFLNIYVDGPLAPKWPADPQQLIPDIITVLAAELPADGVTKKLPPDYDIPQQAAFLPVVVAQPPPPLNPYPESKPQPPRYPWEPMQELPYLPTATPPLWTPLPDSLKGPYPPWWEPPQQLPYLPAGGPIPPPPPTPAGRHRRHYVVRDGDRLLLFANKADADAYRRRLKRDAKPAEQKRKLRVLVKQPEYVIDVPHTKRLAERHGQLGTFLEAAATRRGYVELVKLQSHLIAMEAVRMREEEEIAIALLTML